jgi:hypothetical protein
MDINENDIKSILKQTYNEVLPPDSWEALRSRIDDKIKSGDESVVKPEKLRGNAVFWRRTALALAACLVLVLALLICAIYKTTANQKNTQGLLSQGQVEQLSAVFSNVRELFANQQPWLVVEAGGKGEIGVANSDPTNAATGKILIIRLAVNMQDKLQYYDVVALSSQQVSFSIPSVDGRDMNISLKPTLTSDSKIAVEIDARLNNGQNAGDTVTIANHFFTSLLKVKSDSQQVSIDAVGQSVNI